MKDGTAQSILKCGKFTCIEIFQKMIDKISLTNILNLLFSWEFPKDSADFQHRVLPESCINNSERVKEKREDAII